MAWVRKKPRLFTPPENVTHELQLEVTYLVLLLAKLLYDFPSSPLLKVHTDGIFSGNIVSENQTGETGERQSRAMLSIHPYIHTCL